MYLKTRCVRFVFCLAVFTIFTPFSHAFAREWETLYQNHLIHAAGVTSASVTATWFGTAAFLLDDGETALLIDPFVTRPGLIRVAFGGSITPDTQAIADWQTRLGNPDAAAVIVTHSHYDHAMDAPEFARLSGATVVGSESTLQIARGWGTPADRLQAVQSGDELTFGKFTIRFLESRHGPAMLGRIPYPGTVDAPLTPPVQASGYKLGTAFGLVITHPAGTIVHHGSADTMPEMYAGIQADIVFLGLAGRDNTAQYVQDTAGTLDAHTVAAIHFDNFFRSLDQTMRVIPFLDLPEFFATATKALPDTRLVTLPVGTPVPLF